MSILGNGIRHPRKAVVKALDSRRSPGVTAHFQEASLHWVKDRTLHVRAYATTQSLFLCTPQCKELPTHPSIVGKCVMPLLVDYSIL